ncbi:hypothetical protein D3C72_491710 [compost metagenome]
MSKADPINFERHEEEYEGDIPKPNIDFDWDGPAMKGELFGDFPEEIPDEHPSDLEDRNTKPGFSKVAKEEGGTVTMSANNPSAEIVTSLSNRRRRPSQPGGPGLKSAMPFPHKPTIPKPPIVVPPPKRLPTPTRKANLSLAKALQKPNQTELESLIQASKEAAGEAGKEAYVKSISGSPYGLDDLLRSDMATLADAMPDERPEAEIQDDAPLRIAAVTSSGTTEAEGPQILDTEAVSGTESGGNEETATKEGSEEGYYPDQGVLSRLFKGETKEWNLAEIRARALALRQPNNSDLMTLQTKQEFLQGIAIELECPMLQDLLSRGCDSLSPNYLLEVLRESGEVLFREGGTLYRYAHDKGLYISSTGAFEQAIVVLGMRLYDEIDRIRNAAAVWPTKVAVSLLKALPKKAAVSGLINVCQATLYRLWQDEKRRMNSDQWILNLRNGLLCLRTFTLRPHSSEHLSSIQVPYDYDPNADCPEFKRYLALAVPDPEMRDVLKRWAGYCLIPSTLFQLALILAGPSGTGKGTFIDILLHLLGIENTTAVALEDLGDKFRVGNLKDKLVNLITEVNVGKTLNDARFKAFVAGDMVTGERKNEQPTTFRPFARFVISANAMPPIADLSDAVYRRLLIVKFDQKFADVPNPEAIPPELPRDPYLMDKLKAELSGILNWALEGLREVLEEGDFVRPAKMLDYVQEYRLEQNSILRYATEACLIGPEYEVSVKDVYRCYVAWCKDQGEKAIPNNKFGAVFKTIPGIRPHRTGPKGRHFLGVRPMDT